MTERPDDTELREITNTRPASEESVKIILAADPASPDGRSEWTWFHLSNGDMIFGCFPQGDTYFNTQDDHHD